MSAISQSKIKGCFVLVSLSRSLFLTFVLHVRMGLECIGQDSVFCLINLPLTTSSLIECFAAGAISVVFILDYCRKSGGDVGVMNLTRLSKLSCCAMEINRLCVAPPAGTSRRSATSDKESRAD